MRILFIADARSPIARNWIRYFARDGYEVRVISTYPCDTTRLPGMEVTPVPIAFAGLSQIRHDGTISDGKRWTVITSLLSRLRSGSMGKRLKGVQHWVGPLELLRHTSGVREIIAEFKPDLVHAMRIPFEGIFAANVTPPEFPLLISVWGNDFTLHARKASLTRVYTRRALRRTNALHCDCERDLRLARQFGLSGDKPAVILPGAGGIQRDLFRPGDPDGELGRRLNIRPGAPVVINPRGFRAYVRNDTFFTSIPQVLRAHPDAIFLCTGMSGNAVAERWVAKYGIARSVRLLPNLTREEVAQLFRLATVSVSPSIHDGTPNTLLEAMSCGCLPVAGDIESVREWITDGANGLLCDPTDPDSLALAIRRALGDEGLRARARQHNSGLIARRADYEKVMARASEFYEQVIGRRATSVCGTDAVLPPVGTC